MFTNPETAFCIWKGNAAYNIPPPIPSNSEEPSMGSFLLFTANYFSANNIQIKKKLIILEHNSSKSIFMFWINFINLLRTTYFLKVAFDMIFFCFIFTKWHQDFEIKHLFKSDEKRKTLLKVENLLKDDDWVSHKRLVHKTSR